MAKDAYRETQRYIANLQSIFDFPEEKLQISQDNTCWMQVIGNMAPRILYMSHDDEFERFHAKVKQKLDRPLNEYEGKFTVDQVGTYSVSSQHEQNQEDNQRQIDEE